MTRSAFDRTARTKRRLAVEGSPPLAGDPSSARRFVAESCHEIGYRVFDGSEVFMSLAETATKFDQFRAHIHWIAGAVTHEGAARGLGLHEPFGCQDPNCCLRRVARNLVVFLELSNRWQPGAGRVLARLYLCSELFSDSFAGVTRLVLVRHESSLPNCPETGVDTPPLSYLLS